MLKEKIKEDLKNALKSGDQLSRLTLGMVISNIKNRELTKRGELSKKISDPDQLAKESELTDSEIIEVISSEIKKRKDSIEQFKLAQRNELVEKESKEVEILNLYMPEQLSEEKIREELQRAISEIKPEGIKDLGKVLALIMPKLKGKADGSLVNKIAKELLS